MRPPLVDLLSDTQTRPSPGMRAAMARAEVGDEQRGEDPTVRELEGRVAALLGKEAGVFLPSGTLCNIVAYFVHCRPGDAVVLEARSHPATAEQGGPAVHARVALKPLAGTRGVFTAGDLDDALDGWDTYEPAYGEPVALVSLENTHNLGMGKVWPRETLDAVCAAAARRGIAVHLDGARLLNACAASGVAPADYARACQSVWVDLSKGLGCPAGAVLCGPESFAADARRAKRLFGGALRQAGILAAAGLYALEHHIARLADDHRRAARLAAAVADLPGVDVDPGAVETNIVHLAVRRQSREVAAAVAADGVRVGTLDAGTLRLVTHLDVDDRGLDVAVTSLRTALGPG